MSNGACKDKEYLKKSKEDVSRFLCRSFLFIRVKLRTNLRDSKNLFFKKCYLWYNFLIYHELAFIEQVSSLMYTNNLWLYYHFSKLQNYKLH